MHIIAPKKVNMLLLGSTKQMKYIITIGSLKQLTKTMDDEHESS
jgi:hypothetical protein